MDIGELEDKWGYRIGATLNLWSLGTEWQIIEKNANFIMLKKYLNQFSNEVIHEHFDK
jgi:hypothetical protein